MTEPAMKPPTMPDYDAPIDPHEPDGPGLGDDRYRRDFGEGPVDEPAALKDLHAHGPIGWDAHRPLDCRECGKPWPSCVAEWVGEHYIPRAEHAERLNRLAEFTARLQSAAGMLLSAIDTECHIDDPLAFKDYLDACSDALTGSPDAAVRVESGED